MNALVFPSYNDDLIKSLSTNSDIVVTQVNSYIILQGFLCVDEKNDTCLLGRNGSDTSAALYSVLLRANRVKD